MRIQSPEEYDEVKRLKAELAQAQALNQELALEVFMLRATLGVAEAELGYAVKKSALRHHCASPPVQSADCDQHPHESSV